MNLVVHPTNYSGTITGVLDLIDLTNQVMDLSFNTNFPLPSNIKFNMDLI